MPTDQSSHVHSDWAKWKGWNLGRQSILIWRLGVLFEWSGDENVLLGNGWNLHVNFNPSGKRSSSPSGLLWNDLGAKQVASPRENNIPIDPLAPLMFDGYRTTSCCMWCSILRPNASATVLGGLNSHETPNGTMKKRTMPWKMKNQIYDMLCQEEFMFSLLGMQSIVHLGL